VQTERFSERDVILITYGDLTRSEDRPPLRTLADFASVFFRGLITTLHILPFFPYSSDRGFSVVDFKKVDPGLGQWKDIATIRESFKLMFDGVFNHVSSESQWFRDFRDGVESEQDTFIVFDSRTAIDEERLGLVLRPRTSDLLTEFSTVDGPRFVWTTFSPDQVDLNFKSQRVLLRILDVLLFYTRMGADLIRLDAITYLWYELGTSCAHLEETHQVVKLFRDVLDIASPEVGLVTETNVPHNDNVTYFGDGSDEAQMVYNFALPPLVLHSFQCGDASTLSRWAATLETPSESTAFFNFLDSHDGIGVMGARGILSEEEISAMADGVRDHGGFVSMKANGDGTESPYELNITWFSALNPAGMAEDESLQIRRFLASRAVALALRGVPGIYLPSLFGSKNDVDAVRVEGVKRSINRAAYWERDLFEQFQQPESLIYRVMDGYLELIEARVDEACFHPCAKQEILNLDPRVFAVLREAPDGRARVLALMNVSSDSVTVRAPRSLFAGWTHATNLLGDESRVFGGATFDAVLEPYDVQWWKS